MMITSIELTNFGPIQALKWSGLSGINLIIGKNAAGKTFILKAIYATIKTLESYRRGAEQRSAGDILAEKLYWTFQAEKIGDIVTKGENGPLKAKICFEKKPFMYEFGRDTASRIYAIENEVTQLDSNSIFLPAKEVLSLHQVILQSRDKDRIFGFDDTYVDLARALQIPPTKGNNFKQFSESRKKLEDMLEGRIEYDSKSLQWVFKKGNSRFPIGVTAEGIKKIAIIDTLLGNRYLSEGSTLLIDEPESALHPSAIVDLLEIIALLAERNVQFFIATHSYFVIKKLYLLAQASGKSVMVLSQEKDHWAKFDLKDGLKPNPITDQSIALYEEEVSQRLGR